LLFSGSGWCHFFFIWLGCSNERTRSIVYQKIV
jgi:hypothetical protein